MTALVPAKLPNLTRRCIYHVVSVLHETYAADRQTTLIGQITAYCSDIETVCRGCTSYEGLVQPSHLQQFAEGNIPVKDFCTLLEDSLLRSSNGQLNIEAIHDACFRFYSMEMKSMAGRNQSDFIEQLLSPTCTYRLWLVFNVLTGGEGPVLVPKDNFRDLLKRLFELSGLNWMNDPNELTNKDYLSFPDYIQIVTGHFEKQGLRMPLTCEMVEDVYDEFVCGVQMKGYLVKRGHVRKNYKRRWFILRRTVLTYYQDLQIRKKKGEIILSNVTRVEDIPDTEQHTCGFSIICALSKKLFLLFADTQKAKHQWMMAINKVLVLAKLAERKRDEVEYEQSLQQFCTLKYGTSLISTHVADAELKLLDHYEGQFAGFRKDNVVTAHPLSIKLQAPPTEEQALPTENEDCISESSFPETFKMLAPAPPTNAGLAPAPPTNAGLAPAPPTNAGQQSVSKHNMHTVLYDESDYTYLNV